MEKRKLTTPNPLLQPTVEKRREIKNVTAREAMKVMENIKKHRISKMRSITTLKNKMLRTLHGVHFRVVLTQVPCLTLKSSFLVMRKLRLKTQMVEVVRRKQTIWKPV